MASVVIAGDVSGTCTLQAANAAGTTVLTLPTTSGTLVSTNGSPTFVTVTSTTDNTTTLNATTGNITTVTAGLGNATAPSITFTGDTNTGIFSPTADTIAFTEGGTEAMRIDSSGNVGIGTSSPAAVTGFSAGRTVLQVTPSGGGSAQLRLGAASGTMIDHDDGGNTITTIRNLYGATSATAQMQLQSGFITLNTGTSYTEQMRLNAAGLLQFNSGYGSVATAYGVRAWINLNATGTPAIRGSGNVSSITDNGTGDFTVNFTTAMPDVNFSWAVTQQLNGTGNADPGASSSARTQGTSAWGTGFLRILTMSNTNLVQEDPLVLCIQIFR